MAVLCLVGNIMLGRSFNKKTTRFTPWDDSIVEETKNSDGVIANLDSCITQETICNSRGNAFKMVPSHVFWLNSLNVIHVSLANKHSLDYKNAGLNDTIDYLDSFGITHTGAGMDIKEASMVVYKTINDVKFGFFTVCNNKDDKATTLGYGVNHYDINNNDEKLNLINTVFELNKTCDHLIIYLHWGIDQLETISDEYISLCKHMIKSGASVVCGMGLHRRMPIIPYQGKIICLSLGNLINDFALDLEYRNNESYILNVTFDKNSVLKWHKKGTISSNMIVKLDTQ